MTGLSGLIKRFSIIPVADRLAVAESELESAVSIIASCKPGLASEILAA
jgi:hypothetical protein